MSTVIFGKNAVKDYVTDGAWMQCTVGSLPCRITTTPKKIRIGGKSGCTVRDIDPIVNWFDFGVCSVTQKPCKGCIKLTAWQNYKKDIEIEGANALTEQSVIPCGLGGVISFVQSGQIKANKVTNGAERAKSEHGDACEENAKLQISCVSFGTAYDICSDDYGLIWEKKDKEGNVIESKEQAESDYIKTYILEDGGEYYHWLNKRTNPSDAVKFKPDPLPVTFSGIEPVILKAVLRTVSDKKLERMPQIRVRHKTAGRDKYEFETVSVEKKGSDSYEAVIRSTNWPFEDRIACIGKFELLFEYSEDGRTWLKAGTTRNRLYITWREPLYDSFYDKTLALSSSDKEDKLIHESLLWLGCTNAPTDKLLPKDEETVVRSIFVPFESKRVTRAREGTEYLNIDWSKEGLGYWRGRSAVGGDTAFRALRSVRYLLQYGEARCGEWTDFFLHLLLTQGIDVDEDRDRCAIQTNFFSTYKLNYVSSEKSYEFSVKDARFTLDKTEPHKYITQGDSEGQGNKQTQPTFGDHVWVYFKGKFFLDPSYGKKYREEESTLKHYLEDNLNDMFMRLDSKENYRIPMMINKEYNGYVAPISYIFKDLNNFILCNHTELLN
ncbi:MULTISPECIES: DUF4280 domain-containing protein [unclassified Treponema]|uniref:DUF4280 domain-containing protein n=1 Tax=unclassified Treponema TaxID=2638727 RepID=UPI0020A2C562|nr:MULTISPECIES: DUF4280 domain-containing protein [unclassified Treponema]UTC66612.1 DUF4280 domain-containing protein [Treponema sp. OMZ 789]UTC69344.1 DUF4280 domain-containing protein [Treponema sp. OMZ 790]UTC72059.1 DUF4280 domain-containing protein [Treponema sp. OMZ 791]